MYAKGNLSLLYVQAGTRKAQGSLPAGGGKGGEGFALYARSARVIALCSHYDTPGNLKQLVTEWLSKHPTFAGLATGTWCNLYLDAINPIQTLVPTTSPISASKPNRDTSPITLTYSSTRILNQSEPSHIAAS